MRKITLLDMWFHIQPNFNKHLRYSSLQLFRRASELSFRLILSTTQCLGIIYKSSSKPEICIYYCKELLYCLIFCLAYFPSDTLSKSWACDERKAFVLPAIHLITILPHMKRGTAHQTVSQTAISQYCLRYWSLLSCVACGYMTTIKFMNFRKIYIR